jgi:uroporphyrinogen-III decarboxylase
MPLISPAMMDEIERRKENVRRVWNYQKVDHIPVMLSVVSEQPRYTTQEHFLDGDKQFELELERVKLSLERVPDDYIPAMRPDVGCVVIESALGAEIVFGDDPWQTCNVKEPILNSVDDIYKLKKPNPYTDGLVPEGLRRIKSFVERTDGQVYVSCLDMGGPMNVAFTLLGGVQFYMISYDAPEALEYLAGFVADVFIEFADACIEAAGGIQHVTTTDFPYHWQPEDKKGHMSDDICAQFSPEFFNRFSKPFNNRIYQRYGGGMMHNCGPNPCAMEYLWHEPRIYGVDLAYQYSKGDLALFKQAFKGEGIIYFELNQNPPKPTIEYVEDYRQIMDALAPDVIAIPSVTATSNEDVRAIYDAFYEVAREYAARMNWKDD